MSDLIDRQAAIKKILGQPPEPHYPSWYAEQIKELPPAEPKRGKWIRDGHHIRCDQCGMYICDTDREGDRIPTEFCPHCGADMREVNNESN